MARTSSRFDHTSIVCQPSNARRRVTITLILLIACLTARVAGAQTCTPSEHPFFEYQVDHSPVFVSGDTTMHPRFPSGGMALRKKPNGIEVAFIVDSAGRADPKLLHLLQGAPRATEDSIRVAMESWRFTPAIVSGCHVAHLVMLIFEP